MVKPVASALDLGEIVMRRCLRHVITDEVIQARLHINI